MDFTQNFLHSPWFGRGGHFQHGLGAGVFASVGVHGSMHNYVSFRIVLSF